jgi:hypothetical protein
MELNSDTCGSFAWAHPERTVEIAKEIMQSNPLPKLKDHLYSLIKEKREGVIYRLIMAVPEKALEIAIVFPEYAAYIVGYFPELTARMAVCLPDQAAAIFDSAYISLDRKEYCKKSRAHTEQFDIKQFLPEIVPHIPPARAIEIADKWHSLAADIVRQSPRLAVEMATKIPRQSMEIVEVVPEQAVNIAKAVPWMAVAIAAQHPEFTSQIKQIFKW